MGGVHRGWYIHVIRGLVPIEIFGTMDVDDMSYEYVRSIPREIGMRGRERIPEGDDVLSESGLRIIPPRVDTTMAERRRIVHRRRGRRRRRRRREQHRTAVHIGHDQSTASSLGIGIGHRADTAARAVAEPIRQPCGTLRRIPGERDQEGVPHQGLR